jgi:hypothetical protein
MSATAGKTVVIAGRTTVIVVESAEAVGTVTGSAGVKGTSAGIVLKQGRESEVTAGTDTAAAGEGGTSAGRSSGVKEDTAEAMARTIETTNGTVTIKDPNFATREGIGSMTAGVLPPGRTAGAGSNTGGTAEATADGAAETSKTH